jgi:hypothetical protein
VHEGLFISFLEPLIDDEQLFIQLEKPEYLEALLNGQLRVTQQKYYKYARGQNSDNQEGSQLIDQSMCIVHQAGIDSTYIWCCSYTKQQAIEKIKKFKNYDYGLLILEPKKFLASLTASLWKDPILCMGVDIEHAKVIYTDDDALIVEEGDRTQYNRWTKPLRYKTENEYRLIIHNMLPPNLINDFFNGEHNHRVEPIKIPFSSQDFYRVICNFDFDSNFKAYVFDGERWTLNY